MIEDYRHLAMQLERSILSGELPPGHRLIPQREFAWQRGIAASTASRVYAELRRRGLVNGEVGRGTFVLSTAERAKQPLPQSFVDLDQNFPVVPGQAQLLSRSIRAAVTPGALTRVLSGTAAGSEMHAREVIASFLRRPDWAPEPCSISFTGNGREALASALKLLTRPGDRVGAEAVTYAVLKDIAMRSGVELIPLPMDEEGLVPAGVLEAHRTVGLQAVYVQPTIHNPLGLSMSTERRRALARVLETEQIFAIEDAVNSFLADDTPLAAFAPSRTVLIESLSKRISPALTVGLLLVPEMLRGRASAAVREAAWSSAGVGLSVVVRLVENGVAGELAAAKRTDATARNKAVREELRELEVVGDSRAYHLWLRLPRPWRAEAFVSAAARLGVAVTPGQAFTVGPGHGPSAIRLTTGTPPIDVLRTALKDLRSLAMGQIGVGGADVAPQGPAAN